MNASHCALRTFPAGVAALEQLKALVFSHNHIEHLPPVFPHLAELNTLVLSHNELAHLPKTLPASLPNLKKLSLSHNQLVDGETPSDVLSDDALVDAMMAHPVLINRPLVVSPIGVKLCRPSEAVLDLLPAPQQGAFAKEDGELVVDSAGERVL